ncbi:MAG TPA: N-acetylglutaminylglutamine amidotransferase [Polyangiaceae bacterium]
MCGICGELRFDGATPDLGSIEKMLKPLQPRGPDGWGVVAHGGAALGHRRLKVIDLTENAHQPMVDPELGLSVVYNGAIYNYRELRKELEREGYRFVSTGDTEVLLKAFHAWGERCVERLNGMFAFAIIEHASGNVILGRDRLGIKPLYYCRVERRLRFASSLPALLAAGGVSHSINPVALHHYMTFHGVVPPPHTLLEDVQKLPPGTLMVIDQTGQTKATRYWQPVYGPAPGDAGRGLDDWRDETLAVLRRAVERRLVADVPVGVLLSGGLDSSLLVGLLAEAGHRRLETFSIGFETVRDEAGDEFQFSDLIAKRFETRHHRVFVDSENALAALEQCIAAMSEPMVSHDNVGFFLLSKEVSQHVKVVQSGQGADEIFAGYHWYPPLLESDEPVRDYARHFFDRDHVEMASVLAPEWMGDDHSRRLVEQHFEQPGAQRSIDRALRLDTQVMLADDPVKRVDNMTMRWGLEARVPFLDHELVELAARIPGEFKLRGGGKYVLKEAARRVIPSEVIDRPKGYFPVPALKYLRGPYLERVRDTLESSAARERGLFRPAYVTQLLADPESHITPLRGSKLWQIALLELWLQEHLSWRAA